MRILLLTENPILAIGLEAALRQADGYQSLTVGARHFAEILARRSDGGDARTGGGRALLSIAMPASFLSNCRSSQVTLLADQVLVEPIEEAQQERFEERTPGGLYIPQKAQRNKKREVFHRGLVILCGAGDKYGEGKVRPDGSRAAYAYPQHPDGRFPMSVKPGDLVLYERRAGCDINLNGKVYVVLHEEQHIVAVIE